MRFHVQWVGKIFRVCSHSFSKALFPEGHCLREVFMSFRMCMRSAMSLECGKGRFSVCRKLRGVNWLKGASHESRYLFPISFHKIRVCKSVFTLQVVRFHSQSTSLTLSKTRRRHGNSPGFGGTVRGPCP